jgi:hypothetical protein
MRYSVYFLKTDDESVKNKRPGLANISIKKDFINIELRKKIFYDQILNMSVDYDVSDKVLSGGKAVAGAVIAGPLGALVGLSMGGKKVSTVLTIEYRDGAKQKKYILLETNIAETIKSSIDRANLKHAAKTSPENERAYNDYKKAHKGWLRKSLIFYYTWPLIIYKKLTGRK